MNSKSKMEDLSVKKYYAVCNSYYDNGKVIANLVDTIEAEEKPQDTYKETKRCDVYVNWFESYEEAMEFIKECKMA